MDNNIIDLCSDDDDGATAASTSFTETSKVIENVILRRQQNKIIKMVKTEVELKTKKKKYKDHGWSKKRQKKAVT